MSKQEDKEVQKNIEKQYSILNYFCSCSSKTKTLSSVKDINPSVKNINIDDILDKSLHNVNINDINYITDINDIRINNDIEKIVTDMKLMNQEEIKKIEESEEVKQEEINDKFNEIQEIHNKIDILETVSLE
jgi:hypothetical protein